MENRNENSQSHIQTAKNAFCHADECAIPLLVFNMVFNFDDRWDRVFNQFKIQENST